MKRIREFAKERWYIHIDGMTSYDVECYYSARLDEACSFILALVDVAEKGYLHECQHFVNPDDKRQCLMCSALTALDEKVGEILK